MSDATLPGFATPPLREKLNPGPARTALNRATIASGRHPLTRHPLLGNGETCGSCAHRITGQYAYRYHKCDLIANTHGAATDLRLSWPACDLWKERAK